MIKIVNRSRVEETSRTRRFWISLAVTIGLACVLSVATAIVQSLIIVAVAIDHDVGAAYFLYFSLAYSFPVTALFLISTLPLTLVSALALRTAWLVPVPVYALCGWAMLAGYLWLNTDGSSPATGGLLAVLPAAASGWIIWRRQLRIDPV